MMEMGSHVWEMFVWTKQGNITTSAPPLELSRLNSCQQLAVTVVRTTHEKLLFSSALQCTPDLRILCDSTSGERDRLFPGRGRPYLII